MTYSSAMTYSHEELLAIRNALEKEIAETPEGYNPHWDVESAYKLTCAKLGQPAHSTSFLMRGK
jgi:hypothetical protein